MAFKPKVGEKFTLTATVEGPFDPGENGGFSIGWWKDLPPLAGKTDSVLDDRNGTINNNDVWARAALETTIKSNEAKIEADSTVNYNTWANGSDTNSLEIYACIRAEYKFIGEGYRKLQSRIGPNGIDHLFVKDGARPIVVESKTDSNLANVTNWVEERDPIALIDKLGKGVQAGTTADDKVIFATQMSQVWVLKCLTKLELSAMTDPRADPAAVTQVLRDTKKGRPPRRILNIYGGLNWKADGTYDELVNIAKSQWNKLTPERQAELTGSDKRVAAVSPAVVHSFEPGGEPALLYIYEKWEYANPKKGRFYLLPGKYRIQGRPAEFVGVEEEAQEVDFADEKFRDNEFFYIDKWSKKAKKKLEKPKIDA